MAVSLKVVVKDPCKVHCRAPKIHFVAGSRKGWSLSDCNWIILVIAGGFASAFGSAASSA